MGTQDTAGDSQFAFPAVDTFCVRQAVPLGGVVPSAAVLHVCWRTDGTFDVTLVDEDLRVWQTHGA